MISVIVIGRNEGARLDRCLSSVEKALWQIPHEIIYVDSASSDNSLELARAHSARCLLVNDPSPTAGLGRYIGAEQARYEWCLFLDGDMELDPLFPRYAMAKGDAARADAVTGLRHDLYYRGDELTGENRNYYQCEKARPAPEFGGALMIRREALQKAGGWSPDTVACEEEELHSRLLGQKQLVLEIPDPMIRHTDCVTENRSLLNIVLNPRQLGQGEAFRCAMAKGSAGAYIRFHRMTFLFFLLDWIALFLLLFLRPWGAPALCLLETFQLGYFLARKVPRRFVSQKLFFPYFILGLFTYHVRDRSFRDVTNEVTT
ncbi:MAG: glycosyltransferase family 2 protein [Clostridia bacterium]|nr:glycosyltransferase family 2 protein [Clostridia bacterium]